MKTAKSVVACCIIKSSADVSKIDDDTLRVLIKQCFETSSIELRKVGLGTAVMLLLMHNLGDIRRASRCTLTLKGSWVRQKPQETQIVPGKCAR